MTSYELVDRDGARVVGETRFPVAVGGSGPDALRLPGGESEPLAWLGIDAGDLFVQPADGHSLRVDGETVRTAHWLRVGDAVELLDAASSRLVIEAGERGTRLRVVGSDAKPVLAPPTAPRPSASRSGSGFVAGERIEPVEFRSMRQRGAAESPVAAPPPSARPVRREPVPIAPRPAPRPPHRGARSLVPWLLALPFLAALGLVAFFLLTARSVEVRVEPAPATLEVDAFPAVEIGGRYLLRPGTYGVRAEKDGYRPLEATFEVGDASNQTVILALEKLPGRLAVSATTPAGEPIEGARLAVDGEPVDSFTGGSLAEPLELAPGEHTVRVEADLHRPFEEVVQVAGADTEERITAVLEPRWAPVRFTSEPSGARVVVDGEEIGRTPIVADLVEGVRRFEMTLARHRPYRSKVEVTAGEAISAPGVRLQPSDGNLLVSSEPDGATVTVDGRYRGTTPLDVAVTPGREHRVEVKKAGFSSAERAVTLAPDGSEEVRFTLDPLLGEVRIAAFPPDAELWIDGERRGAAAQTLELPAREHRVEIKKTGHVSHAATVTPVPGMPQVVEVELETVAEAREKTILPVVETVAGELRRIPPGRFQMGASRREPGRRSNETLREVELTRRFYLGSREVTNAEFRRFKKSHDSGTAGGESLALDDHPVVKVTWQDAAAYCNWLSRQEGLPPAYVEVPGEGEEGTTYRLADPPTTGYRLPTEAEWAWVARYPDGEGEAKKYPWGESLPIPPGAGNYADIAAQGVVPGALGEYSDGHATTAPVDAFDPNARGVRQLGGNVAEWVHDVYVVRPPMGSAVERDPTGSATGDLHVIRGSSWMHSTITELRLSFRDYGKEARPDVGFRVARWIDP